MAIKANVVVRKDMFFAELSDGRQIERIDLRNMARALCMEGVKAEDLHFDWRADSGMLTCGRQVALIAELRSEERTFRNLLAAAQSPVAHSAGLSPC